MTCPACKKGSDGRLCTHCGRGHRQAYMLNLWLSVGLAVSTLALVSVGAGNRDESRTFKPGESVWCEADQFSDPIIFEVEAVKFESERIYFAKSVEL